MTLSPLLKEVRHIVHSLNLRKDLRFLSFSDSFIRGVDSDLNELVSKLSAEIGDKFPIFEKSFFDFDRRLVGVRDLSNESKRGLISAIYASASSSMKYATAFSLSFRI